MKTEQPIETYTFSRALHLMRYGGKKMRPMAESNCYFFVKDNKTFYIAYLNGRTRRLLNEDFGKDFLVDDILGSWVEVKE